MTLTGPHDCRLRIHSFDGGGHLRGIYLNRTSASYILCTSSDGSVQNTDDIYRYTSLHCLVVRFGAFIGEIVWNIASWAAGLLGVSDMRVLASMGAGEIQKAKPQWFPMQQ